MRLPKYVERVGQKYRGAVTVHGIRRKTQVVGSADAAHREAIVLRELMSDSADVVTLGDVMAGVLHEVQSKRTAGTLDWYRRQFRAIDRYISQSTYLDQVTTPMIERMVTKRLKEVSNNTVVHHLRAMHRVFAYAIKMGLIEDNPTKRVDYPSVPVPKMDYFEPPEMIELIEKIAMVSREDADFLSVLAYTGIRRSEFLRIRCKDVDLKAMQIWIESKGKNRSLPISKGLTSVLKRMLKRSDGGMLIGGDLQFRYAMRRIKSIIPDPRMHAHAMRHTFITGLVRAGIPLHVIMQLSGHQTLGMLMRYYHQGSEARDALELLPY